MHQPLPLGLLRKLEYRFYIIPLKYGKGRLSFEKHITFFTTALYLRYQHAQLLYIPGLFSYCVLFPQNPINESRTFDIDRVMIGFILLAQQKYLLAIRQMQFLQIFPRIAAPVQNYRTTVDRGIKFGQQLVTGRIDTTRSLNDKQIRRMIRLFGHTLLIQLFDKPDSHLIEPYNHIMIPKFIAYLTFPRTLYPAVDNIRENRDEQTAHQCRPGDRNKECKESIPCPFDDILIAGIGKMIIDIDKNITWVVLLNSKNTACKPFDYDEKNSSDDNTQ